MYPYQLSTKGTMTLICFSKYYHKRNVWYFGS